MMSVVKVFLLLVVFSTSVTAAQESKAKAEKKEKSTSPLLALPIPINEEVRGIKVPYFTQEGKLQMNFDATTAKRIDETHLELSFLSIELFNEAGESDMIIRLPASILDMTTEIINSDEEVFIKRKDFQITGDSMTFNTRTRMGVLKGKVRMLILENSLIDTPQNAEKKQSKKP